MSTSFERNKDQLRADAQVKNGALKDAAESRKTVQDPERTDAPADPGFQYGDWIEGNVG
ncbi:hypothetical protein [Undibacterium terreum]|uniref:Uncharacterized protein n=1 Tax=Undibacterium terreum TaxID=1224302 RepID=A0A916U4E9_9BURK|nr:hypothetical protein [Undibacterium terreum]GGC58244.1 hypothetical protein GCM10011396_01370 [Undibacterium terreum]